MSKNHEYSAEDIQKLEDWEHARLRPSMYIGDTTAKGYFHLFQILLDEALAQINAGEVTKIWTNIDQHGSLSLLHDGYAVPVTEHKEYAKRHGPKVSELEVAMTKLSYGNFRNGRYKTSFSLHGIGIQITNFLSEHCTAIVQENGKTFRQSYKKGVVAEPITQTEESLPVETGMKVSFKPDPEIFGDLTFDGEKIQNRLEEVSMLFPKTRFHFSDERSGEKSDFYSENGISDFLKKQNNSSNLTSIIDSHRLIKSGWRNEKYFEFEKREVAFQFTQPKGTQIVSYCDGIRTFENGTHVDGFKAAVTKVLREFVERHETLEEDLLDSQLLNGLTAVISVHVMEAQFEGPTKTKLGNNEVFDQVKQLTETAFQDYLNDHPDEAFAILEHIRT